MLAEADLTKTGCVVFAEKPWAALSLKERAEDSWAELRTLEYFVFPGDPCVNFLGAR